MYYLHVLLMQVRLCYVMLFPNLLINLLKVSSVYSKSKYLLIWSYLFDKALKQNYLKCFVFMFFVTTSAISTVQLQIVDQPMILRNEGVKSFRLGESEK